MRVGLQWADAVRFQCGADDVRNGYGEYWPEADLDSAQKGVRNPIPCRRLDWLMAAAEGQADVTRADRE
ncbi:MAG: hypothetical protein AB7U75_20710, partial [Hyphomicrobiaceae bacterium]